MIETGSGVGKQVLKAADTYVKVADVQVADVEAKGEVGVGEAGVGEAGVGELGVGEVEAAAEVVLEAVGVDVPWEKPRSDGEEFNRCV